MPKRIGFYFIFWFLLFSFYLEKRGGGFHRTLSGTHRAQGKQQFLGMWRNRKKYKRGNDLVEKRFVFDNHFRWKNFTQDSWLVVVVRKSAWYLCRSGGLTCFDVRVGSRNEIPSSNDAVPRARAHTKLNSPTIYDELSDRFLRQQTQQRITTTTTRTAKRKKKGKERIAKYLEFRMYIRVMCGWREGKPGQ